jgi:hypothetical protein
MKATEFNLARDLKFDPQSGITSFGHSRLVIMDADAVGFLKQKVTELIGPAKARELYLKFGYQHGVSDFLQMKMNYQFDSEMDLLASGPAIHTWEGIVNATPNEIRFNRETDEFYFTGSWKNSYEGQQYLQLNPLSSEPVCWTLMGYASGWATAFFGKPLFAFEPTCIGKGDPCCQWLIKPVGEFGDECAPYISALREFWKET